MFDLNGALERFAGKLALENILTAALTLLVCLVAVRLLLKLVRRLLSRTKLEERIRRYILTLLKLLLYTLTVSSHPFAIGDFIESGGVSGTVEEISLNHTKLITPDGLTALLPNKELAASKVTNYTVLGQRRIVWKMTASYGAPTETVKAACYRAVEATEHILPDPAPAVYLTAFGESGIDFTVYCWAAAEDFWGAQFALAENLRAEFAKAGVEIPYNKLDVHIVEDSK